MQFTHIWKIESPTKCGPLLDQ